MVKGLLNHEMAKLKVTVNCPIEDPRISQCWSSETRLHNMNLG